MRFYFISQPIKSLRGGIGSGLSSPPETSGRVPEMECGTCLCYEGVQYHTCYCNRLPFIQRTTAEEYAMYGQNEVNVCFYPLAISSQQG